MNRSVLYRITLLLVCLVMALSAAACSLFPEEEEELPVPLMEVKQAEYVTKSPRRETIENRVAGSSTVVPVRAADVAYTTTGGTIDQMYFMNGDYVEEGDLLCTLVSTAAEEKLTEAEMRAEISEMEYDRAKTRYENGELDEIAWKQAELNIYIVRRDLEKLRESYSAAQLYAPISGTVTYRASIDSGSAINAGDILYTISDMTKLYVRYAGSDYAKLPLYAKCDMSLSVGALTESYVGTVIQTPDNLPENAVAIDRFSVLLELDHALPEGVGVGAQLDLSYLIERSENALVITKSAIKTSGSRNYVYVLEDGYRRERDVVVGVISGYDAEILKGLDESDQIIY